MKFEARTYTLSIERFTEGYLAYFPALEGCHSWGRSYEEAVVNAEEALTLYIEALDELGRPLPEERGIKKPVSLGVTVRMPTVV